MAKIKSKRKKPQEDSLLTAAMRDAGVKMPWLADRAKTTRQTIQRLAKGKRTLSKAWAERLAPHLGKKPTELMFGSDKVDVIGKVGGGTKVYPFDDHAQGAGFEQIDRPEGVSGVVVGLIVSGDSMFPRYKNGEYLVHGEKRPPADLIGQECVVWLSDGSVLVKDLLSGVNGHFNLYSHNAPLIQDAEVIAAAPVLARVNRRAR